MRVMNVEIEPQTDVINWTEDIPIENFNSAVQYLALLTTRNKAMEIADRLKDFDYVRYQPPGLILMAAGLIPLQPTAKTVQNALRAINSKDPIPYPLLVQSRRGERTHIVSGYDVISAVHFVNPERNIPCVIAPWDYE